MSRPPLERFFHDCEFSGPLRLASRSAFLTGGPWAEHVRDAPFAVVGSDPRCDVVPETFGVAPRHCFLQAFGPRVICVDLRRGDMPRESGWLDDRVGLRVGPVDLIREPDEDQFSLSAEDAPLVDGRVPFYDLDFQTRHVQTTWRMRRPLALIGSARDCALRLSGSRVAERHAALVLTGRGLWVVDLLGRVESARAAGILVNGEPARFARLDPGDVLEIGKFRVTARPTGLSDGAVVVVPAPSRPAAADRPADDRPHAPAPVGPDALWSAFEARLADHAAEQDEAFTRIQAMAADVQDRQDAPPAPPAEARGATPGGATRGLAAPATDPASPFAVSVIAGLTPPGPSPSPAESAGDVS